MTPDETRPDPQGWTKPRGGGYQAKPSEQPKPPPPTGRGSASGQTREPNVVRDLLAADDGGVEERWRARMDAIDDARDRSGCLYCRQGVVHKRRGPSCQERLVAPETLPVPPAGDTEGLLSVRNRLIKRLTVERDEARAEVERLRALGDLPVEHAALRAQWDRLKAENEALRVALAAERDRADRLAEEVGRLRGEPAAVITRHDDETLDITWPDGRPSVVPCTPEFIEATVMGHNLLVEEVTAWRSLVGQRDDAYADLRADREALRQQVAAALRDHWWSATDDETCSCGWVAPMWAEAGTGSDDEAEHAAMDVAHTAFLEHQASALVRSLLGSKEDAPGPCECAHAIDPEMYDHQDDCAASNTTEPGDETPGGAT